MTKDRTDGTLRAYGAIFGAVTGVAMAVPRAGAVCGMAKDTCPVRWTGGRAVVTLPCRVDASNASQITEQLLWLINRGATALIVDMAATVSCDCEVVTAVVRAYKRAVASGTQLRLVVAAQVVRRFLMVNGLHRLLPIYPSLDAATAGPASGLSKLA